MTPAQALDVILEKNKAAYLLNIPSVRDALMEYFSTEIGEMVRESKRFNYLFSIAFSVDTDVSPDDLASDDVSRWIPVADLKAALLRRVTDVTQGQHPDIYEAIGVYEDFYDRVEEGLL